VTLDSLITVLGLLVAVYAVIPRVRRLEFRLRFGAFGWVLVVVALTLVLYLQFYQSFRSLGLTPNLNLSRWHLNPENFSFIVLVGLTILLVGYVSFRKLTRHRIFQFRDFILELSRERRYAEMYSLVEGNLNELSKIYHSNFMLSRVRCQLEQYANPFSLLLGVGGQGATDPSPIGSRLHSVKMKVCPILAKLFPAYSRESDAARQVIHELLMNRRTVRGMIEARPYCALEFYKFGFYEYFEFFDKYLEELIKDADSIFYHEIRHNQNLSRHYGYELPERNKLLNFLFSDCSVSEKLAPYKPIGEAVISELDRLHIDGMADLYNGPMRDFREESQWGSIIFVGIRFFDIMVTSALRQNVGWHMWLYYFHVFAERIVRNLKPDAKYVDLSAEWPTRYHYLLYEIVSHLCGWVVAVEYVPITQSNVMLETPRALHENGNIPKSAMLALGLVFRAAFTSNSVDQRFRTYLAEVVFRRYFSIRQREDLRPYSEALLNALRAGGFEMGRRPEGYSEALLTSFSQMDLVPYDLDACNEVRDLLKSDVAE